MRQFLVSAGRMFNTRSLFAMRRPGMEPTRGVTRTSTKDHPVEEPKMSGWEQTKEKIANKGKAGFGSDTKPVEMPIVERARVKGADRQGAQHQRMEQASGNANLKTSLQSDMDAGIGINQSDATASKKWTDTAKDQMHDFGAQSKKGSQEQMARDVASGKNQDSGMSKEMQDKMEKQRRADERAAKYPNMEKQEGVQKMAPERERKQTDKITDVINEEHGIPEVKNTKPGKTGVHEQHGMKQTLHEDAFSHQPKMRFDPARSSAENAQKSTEKQSYGFRSTADNQKLTKDQHGMVDNVKEKAGAAADWMKEKLGADTTQQKTDVKKAKAEGKQEAAETAGKVQPQMRGEFGVPSGSPIGGLKAPERPSGVNRNESKQN